MWEKQTQGKILDLTILLLYAKKVPTATLGLATYVSGKRSESAHIPENGHDAGSARVRAFSFVRWFWFSTGQQRINKHTPHLAPRRQTLLMGPVGGDDTAAAAAVLKRELDGAPSRPAPLPRWGALANRRGTKRHG